MPIELDHTILEVRDLEASVPFSRDIVGLAHRGRSGRSGIPFGDSPSSPVNMRGPGRSTGVRGATASVSFSDPDGHLLEILTYEGRDGDSAPGSTA